MNKHGPSTQSLVVVVSRVKSCPLDPRSLSERHQTMKDHRVREAPPRKATGGRQVERCGGKTGTNTASEPGTPSPLSWHLSRSPVSEGGSLGAWGKQQPRQVTGQRPRGRGILGGIKENRRTEGLQQ